MQGTGELSVVRIGGVEFAVSDSSSALDQILDGIKSGELAGASVRFSNAFCVAEAQRDERYLHCLNGPGVTFPDGAPVAALMRRLHDGTERPGRVRGPSFFRAFLDSQGAQGLTHAFVGGSPAVIDQLKVALAQRNPSFEGAVYYSPPVLADPVELTEDILRNVTTTVDVIWLGLGSPKQDLVAEALSRRTGATCIGVGAAFDFAAGTVAEAPAWMQNNGLEWLFRLLQEPGRLWRRYLYGNAKFLHVASREILLKGDSNRGHPQ